MRACLIDNERRTITEVEFDGTEVERVYNEERHAVGDRLRQAPPVDPHPPFPSLLDQYTALVEQYQMAEERAEAAEHQRDYFAAMMEAVATQAKLDDDQMAEIGIKVRANRESEERDQ